MIVVLCVFYYGLNCIVYFALFSLYCVCIRSVKYKAVVQVSHSTPNIFPAIQHAVDLYSGGFSC